MWWLMLQWRRQQRLPQACGWPASAGQVSRRFSRGTSCSQQGSSPRAPTFHVLCTSPVCMSQALHTRLREEEIRVLLSGLTARAVMGSESCTAGSRSARASWL